MPERRRGHGLMECVDLAASPIAQPGYVTDPLFAFLVGFWWWIRGVPDDRKPKA